MAARGYTFQADVSTSAAALSTSAQTGYYGFTIKAHDANTGKVYFGYTNAVAATTGFELGAGQAYYVPKNAADSVADVYAIGSTGTQRVSIEGS